MGMFTTANYPDEYENDMNCTYKISVEDDKFVLLIVQDFSTELNWDRLNVSTFLQMSKSPKNTFTCKQC